MLHKKKYAQDVQGQKWKLRIEDHIPTKNMRVFGGMQVLADLVKTKRLEENDDDWITRATYDQRGPEGKRLASTSSSYLCFNRLIPNIFRLCIPSYGKFSGNMPKALFSWTRIHTCFSNEPLDQCSIHGRVSFLPFCKQR
jgi:hypothetical protein